MTESTPKQTLPGRRLRACVRAALGALPVVAALALTAPGIVAEAAEIGRIRVASGAGDPLQVAIELRDAAGGQYRPTTAVLANRSIYAQRGLPYPDDLGPILVDLYWASASTAIIRLRASGAARTPTVSLLIDIRWNDGAVTRQLTTIEVPRTPVAVVQSMVPAPPLVTPPRPPAAAPVPEWGGTPPGPRPRETRAAVAVAAIAPAAVTTTVPPPPAPPKARPARAPRAVASPSPRPQALAVVASPMQAAPKVVNAHPPAPSAATPAEAPVTAVDRAPGAVGEAARLPDLKPAAEAPSPGEAPAGSPGSLPATAPTAALPTALTSPVAPASPTPDRLSISRADLPPPDEVSAPSSTGPAPMAAGEHQVANEIVQSEARGRIETLNSTLNAMRTLIAYKDEQIARLQQRLLGSSGHAPPSLNPGLLPMLEARSVAAPVLAALPVLSPVAGQRLALPSVAPNAAPRQGGWIATAIAMAIATLLTLIWVNRYRRRDYRSPGPSHNAIMRGVLGQEPNVPHSIFRGNA